jgi:hypothetical protein
MAYEGDLMDACGLFALDFRKVAVVAVSGSGPNVCGHLILYSEANGGYYFHVAGAYGYPRYMSEANYRRYLGENRKRELSRRYLALPNPEGAASYVEKALSAEWRWWVLPHNCVTFCEKVIAAGGGQWSSYSNCPAIATDVPESAIRQFLGTLDGEIRRLYGVAR